MLDEVLEWLTPVFSEWGLLIVFVATFLESGIFVASIVPGESMLLLGGFFASPDAVPAGYDALDIRSVMAVAFAGAVAGDIVGYVIGRVAGRQIVRRMGRFVLLPERRLPLLERYVERYGARAVLFGRFAPFLRSVRTLVVGIARMPFGRFLLPDAAGAAMWAAGVVLAGFVLGESWRTAQNFLGAGGLVVLIILIALFAVTWRAMKRRLEREITATAEDSDAPG